MSFSTRAIMYTPPPSNRAIRSLGAALWALPVVISIGCLAAVPSKTSNALASVFLPKQEETLASLIYPHSAERLEPKRFRKVATTPYKRTLLDVRGRNEKFPMLLAFLDDGQQPEWKRIASHSGKKVDIKIPVAMDPVASIGPASRPVPTLYNTGSAKMIETIVLHDAQAVAPNVVTANGVTIVISGIEPLGKEARCRRLDGVMEDCNHRAQARLSVLMMDRRLECRVSAPIEPDIRIGRCQAGKIDISSDLLRHRLVRRASARG